MRRNTLLPLFTCSSCFNFIAACHGNKADIIFLLDSSASEGATNFQHQLEFVQNFTDNFDIGPDAVQIGLATFSTKPHGYFWLNTYQNKTDLVNATGYVPYLPGSTFTDLGLQFALVIKLAHLSVDKHNYPPISFQRYRTRYAPLM